MSDFVSLYGTNVILYGRDITSFQYQLAFTTIAQKNDTVNKPIVTRSSPLHRGVPGFRDVSKVGSVSGVSQARRDGVSWGGGWPDMIPPVWNSRPHIHPEIFLNRLLLLPVVGFERSRILQRCPFMLTVSGTESKAFSCKGVR